MKPNNQPVRISKQTKQITYNENYHSGLLYEFGIPGPGVYWMVEHLPTMYEVLGSVLRTTKK
jgi:hypothetical protein